MGRCQRSRVERSVWKEEQLKRWMVVPSDRLQIGQDEEGVLMLFLGRERYLSLRAPSFMARSHRRIKSKRKEFAAAVYHTL